MSIAARAVVEDANVFWIFQDEIKAINERRRARSIRKERSEASRPDRSLRIVSNTHVK